MEGSRRVFILLTDKKSPWYKTWYLFWSKLFVSVSPFAIIEDIEQQFSCQPSGGCTERRRSQGS